MKLKSKPSAATGIMLVGALILLVAGYLWWHTIRNNPERAFWGTLNNALRTSAYGTEITQSQGDQSLVQRVLVQLTGSQAAQAQTLLNQGQGTKVLTEAIGTPSEDYARYLLISTDQLGASGKPLDFSKVLNRWGKQSGDRTTTNGQLYNQIVLGVVPLGNLTPAQREQMMPLMKAAYQVSFSNVTKKTVNGRPTYSYNVKVLPGPYVAMLKEYANIVGLTQFKSIDPVAYADGQAVSVQITVDVWSRQLTKIRYIDNDRQEVLTSMGIQLPAIEPPTHTTSVEELQSELQSVQ